MNQNAVRRLFTMTKDVSFVYDYKSPKLVSCSGRMISRIKVVLGRRACLTDLLRFRGPINLSCVLRVLGNVRLLNNYQFKQVSIFKLVSLTAHQFKFAAMPQPHNLKLMKHIWLSLLLALLAVLCSSYEKAQSVNMGGWKPLRRVTANQVPRYYICGAQANTRTYWQSHPHRCVRKPYVARWRCCHWHWFHRRCRTCAATHWRTVCTPVPNTIGWIRSNGITFRFCHFQDWNAQTQLTHPGNWPWYGMVMCPRDQYAHGFRIKSDTRDGLSGLMLYCRNIKNYNINSEVLVYQREGAWQAPIITNDFIHAFQVREDSWFLTGLLFHFTPAPMVTSFKLKYQLPQAIKPNTMILDHARIANGAHFAIVQKIKLDREKDFERIWTNDKGQFRGVPFRTYNTLGGVLSQEISIPSIKINEVNGKNEYSLIDTQNKMGITKFMFDQLKAFKVHQHYENEITVPACTELIVRQTLSYLELSIPYVATVTLSSGGKTQTENIPGIYRGTVTGSIQVDIGGNKIAPCA